MEEIKPKRKYIHRKDVSPNMIAEIKKMMITHSKKDVAAHFNLSRPTLDKLVALNDEQKNEIKTSNVCEKILAGIYNCSVREVRKIKNVPPS